MPVLAALIAALLMLPSDGSTAELPVTYVVEMEGFHKHVRPSSLLSFELFGDAECTARLHTEELTAGGLELLAESRDPRLSPGGTGASALVLRLLASLDSPITGGALFLRVSGEGLVARGEECQAQAPTGPIDSSGVPVLDASGASLGETTGFAAGAVGTLVNPALGAAFSLDASSGGVFSIFGDVLFEEPDCHGAAYTNAPMDGLLLTNELWGEPRRLFLVRAAEVTDGVSIGSRIQPTGSGRCETTTGVYDGLVEARIGRGKGRVGEVRRGLHLRPTADDILRQRPTRRRLMERRLKLDVRLGLGHG